MKNMNEDFLQTNCTNCAAPINYNEHKCDYCGTFYRRKSTTYQEPTRDPLLPNAISNGHINIYATAFIGSYASYGTAGIICANDNKKYI